MREELKDLIAEVRNRWPEIEVEIQDAPHVPKPLPKGKQAVFAFLCEGRVFLVGRVGPRSSARFQSQHYNSSSSPSNFAKLLEQNKDALGLDIVRGREGEWIKERCTRINFYAPADTPTEEMKQLKEYLELRMKPVFSRARRTQAYRARRSHRSTAHTIDIGENPALVRFPLEGRLREVSIRQSSDGQVILEIRVDPESSVEKLASEEE